MIKTLLLIAFLTPVQENINILYDDIKIIQQQYVEDLVWSVMVNKESKGRQLTRDGNPLTSHKGAIGVAQVMPDTAKWMAKRLNIEFDATLYKTDLDYNMRLGRAYFDYNLSIFNDPVLAAMAYNAGTTKVKQWINRYGNPSEKNDLTYRKFVANIPYKETRDYATNIMEKLNYD